MKSQSLEEQWQQLVRAARIPPKGTVQYQEMRRAYWAGVAAYQQLLSYTASDECSEDEGVRLLEQTSRDIERFAKDLSEGRA